MASQQQVHGSDGWHGSGDARSNGWPLGLHPLNFRARHFEHHHHLRFSADAASLFMSTPSVTSDSSSDLDTESTGSFFPERSTTLGSLIGIYTRSQSDRNNALVPAHQSETQPTARRKSAGYGGSASIAAIIARSGRGSRSLCLLLGCGGSHPEAIGISPSLAHLLAIERKASQSQRQNETMGDATTVASVEESILTTSANTLFDEERILPPQPAGAPLKFILQNSSPGSSYLSADWDVFPHQRTRSVDDDEIPGTHGRLSSFCPGICGRISASLAT